MELFGKISLAVTSFGRMALQAITLMDHCSILPLVLIAVMEVETLLKLRSMPIHLHKILTRVPSSATRHWKCHTRTHGSTSHFGRSQYAVDYGVAIGTPDLCDALWHSGRGTRWGIGHRRWRRQQG
jgi:hypothetical protein